MRLKGVCYDVGVQMWMNWRPSYKLDVVKRELEIIKKDLNCNAVRISGLDLSRVTAATEAAFDQGLEVWFSPMNWDKSADETLAYIVKAAKAAEELRAMGNERLVLCLGGEFTLFMKGIVPGKNLPARLTDKQLIPSIKAGKHNAPLNAFLARAAQAARASFSGKITYASLVWESVDWGLFDYVGVDHYRSTGIEARYLDMLKPEFASGKPVVLTEFGYATCPEGIGGGKGFLSSAGLSKGVVDTTSQFFHYQPIIGRLFHPRVNGSAVRDEAWQAKKLVEQLTIIDGAGVDGAFVSQFVSQIHPYSDDPRHDLDVASTGLVKYYEGGRRGETYPDMSWEPKDAFRAVADFYSSH